jgi:hypothetical protein
VDKLHNEEFKEIYCSPNIVRVIKSRRMRWGNVLPMGRREGVQGFGGKTEGMGPVERQA